MTRDTDTHPKGGDSEAAPFMGSGGRQASPVTERMTHPSIPPSSNAGSDDVRVVTVIQADRDAAADYVQSHNFLWAQDMRAGKSDGHSTVQAFARHRIECVGRAMTTAGEGASFKGTEAAFKVGAEAYKRAGGAKAGLKRAVAAHRGSTPSDLSAARAEALGELLEAISDADDRVFQARETLDQYADDEPDDATCASVRDDSQGLHAAWKAVKAARDRLRVLPSPTGDAHEGSKP